MAGKLILFDSNLLIFSLDRLSPKHKKSLELLRKASLGKIDTLLTPQNVTETYRVITDSKALKHPFTPSEAIRELRKVSSVFHFIYPNQETQKCLFNLLKKYNIEGVHVFDAFLIATMLSNGVNVLCTDNEKDFRVFKEVEIVNPFK